MPAAFMNSLESDFPEATFNKTSLNDEDQYKLEVSAEDSSNLELYADAEGNGLEM